MKRMILQIAIFVLTFLPLSSLNAAPELYEHPAGLEFTYPDNWAVNESSFADVELVPADQSKGAQGPTEAYFLWGLGIEESRSSQSQIEFKLHELMSEIASFLKQSEEPEAFIGKKTSGLIYTWEGIRPDGVQVRSRIFALPQKDIAFILVALGVHEEIVKRESDLAGIFGSFVYKPKPSNQSLSGLWESTAESSSEQTQPLDEEKSTMQLREDGTFSMENAGTLGVEKTTGRWFGGGGKIYFISPGNVSLTYRYELRGEPGHRKLSLIHQSGDRQEMTEAAQPQTSENQNE